MQRALFANLSSSLEQHPPVNSDARFAYPNHKTILYPAIVGWVAVLLCGVAGAASADLNKWCAVNGGGMGDARNCQFVTIEQCRNALSGTGGFCEANLFYTGPERGVGKRKTKHDRRTL
jgi:hypothetical protein